MARRRRSPLWAALALGAGLGLTGLVQAQQEPAPAPLPVQPHVRDAVPIAPTEAQPVAPEPAPPTAVASDDSQDEGEPASSRPVVPPKPVEPLKRPRYAVAVLQALDKVSAETVRFEAPINQPIRYKSLIFVVKACETTAPDETINDAAAHVEIVSQPKGPDGEPPPPGKQVFRGWMFANSPGLNLFQHPVYDAWLIACKTAAPPA